MKKTSDIQDIIDELQAGRVVSFPTDTVYAVAALATASDAIEDIYRVKKRQQNNPLAVLARDLDVIPQYIEMSLVAEILSSAFMPGPFTLVSPKKEACKETKGINPEFDTLGVRVPDHDIALSILQEIDQPVVATSANFSGDSPALSVEEVEMYFSDADITLLDIPSACAGMASTVIEVKESGYPVVLREGKITEMRIQQVLEEAALIL